MKAEEALHDLAGEFFRDFSRMEYALKVSGYLQQDRRGNAQPNWDRFANETGPLILRDPNPSTSAAVSYYLLHTPKKQVVRGGQLAWNVDLLADQPNHLRLLLFLRRARNNLFHGGKFNGRWFEAERSEKLILHGLELLRACRRANDDVNSAFVG